MDTFCAAGATYQTSFGRRESEQEKKPSVREAKAAGKPTTGRTAGTPGVLKVSQSACIEEAGKKVSALPVEERSAYILKNGRGLCWNCLKPRHRVNGYQNARQASNARSAPKSTNLFLDILA